MNINAEDFTITIPLGTCDDYTIDLIQHYLKNYNNNIVVIYREKTPNDYVLNPRVKYVKNIEEKHYTKVFNQCIKECDSEYIFYNAWKVKPEKEEFLYAISKLNEGYGFVDLFPCLVSSVFSKHLISKIGFLDERYSHSNEVDWDFICTLKHYDISYHGEKKTKLNKWITMQAGSNSNGRYDNYHKFSVKWKNTEFGFKRLIQEKNYKDKNIYKNVFNERNYLPFKDSVIESEFIIERCNLKNSGISFDYLKENLSDEEKVLLSNLINIEY